MVAPFSLGTGAAVSDFIREIDEDLRRENLEKLARKYGGYALAAAILVVLTIAAYTGWQRYTESYRAERARQYESVLQLVASGDAKAPDELAALAADDDGYGALARFQSAALKAKAGDSAGAAAVYEQLAADGAVDQHLRDLAVILLALQTADTAAPDALTRRLEPLTEPGNPWRYSALEITAVLARRNGDTAKAQEILTGLADDLDAPALRQRATEMLAALKG
jgi:hypothetical protein